jgi:hypothetical protein
VSRRALRSRVELAEEATRAAPTVRDNNPYRYLAGGLYFL